MHTKKVEINDAEADRLQGAGRLGCVPHSASGLGRRGLVLRSSLFYLALATRKGVVAS